MILWIAFLLGGDDGAARAGSLNLVDLAKGSGANFAVFALFASASFLLVVRGGAVLRRHRGVRGVLVEPALPAGRPDPPGPAGAAEGDRGRRCCRSAALVLLPLVALLVGSPRLRHAATW